MSTRSPKAAPKTRHWLLLLTPQGGDGWAVTAEQETDPSWAIPMPESVPAGEAPPECLPPDEGTAGAEDWYAPIYCEDYA